MIIIFKNKNYNHKMRYLSIIYFTIRYLIENGYLILKYVNLEDNLRDPLLKGLAKPKVTYIKRDGIRTH